MKTNDLLVKVLSEQLEDLKLENQQLSKALDYAIMEIQRLEGVTRKPKLAFLLGGSNGV